MCKATRSRTRSRPSDCRVAPSPAKTSATAPATAVGRAQIVGAKRFFGLGRCAQSGRRSVHWHPKSFAHAGTAMSGGRTGGDWPFWRAGQRPSSTSAMVAEDAAFRNARENSDRENTRVEAEKAIQRAMVAIIYDRQPALRAIQRRVGLQAVVDGHGGPARLRSDGLRSASGLRRLCRGVFPTPLATGGASYRTLLDLLDVIEQ